MLFFIFPALLCDCIISCYCIFSTRQLEFTTFYSLVTTIKSTWHFIYQIQSCSIHIFCGSWPPESILLPPISICIADGGSKVTSQSWIWTQLFWCPRSGTFLNKLELTSEAPENHENKLHYFWVLRGSKSLICFIIELLQNPICCFSLVQNLKYIKKYLLLCCLFAFLFLNVLLRSTAEILSWHVGAQLFPAALSLGDVASGLYSFEIVLLKCMFWFWDFPDASKAGPMC